MHERLVGMVPFNRSFVGSMSLFELLLGRVMLRLLRALESTDLVAVVPTFEECPFLFTKKLSCQLYRYVKSKLTC